MMDENEHLEALNQMRATMVTARRKFAAHGNVDEVIDYRSKIEAIQRAIDDEKKMRPSPTAMFGTSTRA